MLVIIKIKGKNKMNIFILDNDIEKCAQSHVDKHMKQILESAQMLCTAIRIHGGTRTILTDPLGKKKVVYLLPDETHKFIKQEKKVKRIDDYGNVVTDIIVTYKLWLSSGLYVQSHVNHPCSVWVRESYYNFRYLFDLTVQLNKEYKHRYHKDHKSYLMIIETNILQMAKDIMPILEITPFALCMPEEYKVNGDAVQSYRNYYNCAKRDLHKWTNRNKPEWVTE